MFDSFRPGGSLYIKLRGLRLREPVPRLHIQRSAVKIAQKHSVFSRLQHKRRNIFLGTQVLKQCVAEQSRFISVVIEAMETGLIAKMQGHQDRLQGDRESHHAATQSQLSQIKAIPTVHEIHARIVEMLEIGGAASVKKPITEITYVLVNQGEM